MKTQEIGYSLKRVSKVNLTVIYMLTILIAIETIITKGLGEDYKILLARVAVILTVNTTVFFLPIKEQIKGVIFCSFGALLAFQDYFMLYTPSSHFLIIMSISMSALYFQKEIVIIIGSLIDVLLILLYFIKPETITLTAYPLTYFLKAILFFNAMVILIYFLTKWGRELVNSVMNKEAETRILFEKLNQTLEKVNEVSLVFDNDLKKFKDNIITMSRTYSINHS